jgi:FtsZ-binding cell division protein ZapB
MNTKEVRYIALYDYAGTDENTLSVAKGDEIRVISQKSDLWWYAVKGEKVGYIPSNYLTLVKPKSPLKSPMGSPRQGVETIQSLKEELASEKKKNNTLENEKQQLTAQLRKKELDVKSFFEMMRKLSHERERVLTMKLTALKIEKEALEYKLKNS